MNPKKPKIKTSALAAFTDPKELSGAREGVVEMQAMAAEMRAAGLEACVKAEWSEDKRTRVGDALLTMAYAIDQFGAGLSALNDALL